MTSKNKKRLQELKSADLLQIKFQEVLMWTKKHQALALKGAAVILAVSLGAGGWLFVRDHFKSKEVEALSTIDRLFLDEEDKISTPKEALYKELQSIQSKLMKLSSTGTELTKESKDHEEVLKEFETKRKELEALKADHTQSTTQYLEYYKKNPKSPEGLRAGVTAAHSLVEAKKFQEAADIVQQVLSAKSKDDFYNIHLRAYYISLLEELNKLDEALVEAQTLVTDSTGDSVSTALLTQGRLLMLAKKNAEALPIFDRILDEFHSSPEVTSARAYKFLAQE